MTRLLLIGALGSAFLFTQAAHARCPEGYTQIGERTEEKGDTIIVHPICKANSPPNLAKDPNAVRLGEKQLAVVDRRIEMINKSIELLGAENPEWERERDRVLDDMYDDAKGLSVEGLNLLTIGLAEWFKWAAQSNIDSARINVIVKAFKGPLASLPAEEAKLNRIMAESSDPQLRQAIVEYTALLRQLEAAHRTGKVTEMAAKVRDAAEVLHAQLELMEQKPPSRLEDNGLYVSSAIMGRFAMIFLEGTEATAALAGSVTSSIAVGGRELVNLWQERSRLQALDRNASARNAMKHELQGRLGDLEQERQRLVWGIERAR